MFSITIEAEETLHQICTKINTEFESKMEFTWRPPHPSWWYWPSLLLQLRLWILQMFAVHIKISDVQVGKVRLSFLFIRGKMILTEEIYRHYRRQLFSALVLFATEESESPQ
jgi:hypothetical protein